MVIGFGLRIVRGLQEVAASRCPDLGEKALAELCDIDCEEAKAAKVRENAAGMRGSIQERIATARVKLGGVREYVTGVYRSKLLR